MKTAHNVTIGDKFTKGKNKQVCEVIDIYTVTNSNGEFVRNICVAETEALGQKMKWEVPFATVVLNKIN